MSLITDIAFRYARPRRELGFISVISVISAMGVFVGVMATLIVLSVMNGFRTELQERILGIHAHVIVVGTNTGDGITEYTAIAEQLETRKDVTAAAPFIYGKGMISGPFGDDGIIIKGIHEARESGVTDLLERLDVPHDPLAPRGEDDMPGVYLGHQLAAGVGARRGDTVRISLPFSGVRSPFGYMPRVRKFRVAGILRSGMADFDATLALIDLATGQRLFYHDQTEPTDHVTAIQLRIPEMDRAREVGRSIIDDLGPLSYQQNNWIDLNSNLWTWMRLEKIAMFLVTALIVVVASFSIVSTLIMVVMKKRRDIGILTTMGADPSAIQRIFLLQGLLIGGTGIVAGVIGGWLISTILDRTRIIDLPDDVYLIGTLPVRMEWLDFVIVPAIALLICLGAALYPAWRAARLDPVEAIRFE
jgi:lipoprotein-releasing system permease protein